VALSVAVSPHSPLAPPPRSLLGNASAANASEALKAAKESASLGAQFLKSYRTHSTAGPVVGSAFESSRKPPSSPSLLYPRLGPPTPALFSGDGLLSQRAKETIERVKTFVRDEVFPREREIQEAGYEGPDATRWKV
jgi:hypothetical protein